MDVVVRMWMEIRERTLRETLVVTISRLRRGKAESSVGMTNDSCRNQFSQSSMAFTMTKISARVHATKNRCLLIAIKE
jgi:hypothetical protein